MTCGTVQYSTSSQKRSSWLWLRFSKGRLDPCDDATPVRPTVLQVPETRKTSAIFTDHGPSKTSDFILIPVWKFKNRTECEQGRDKTSKLMRHNSTANGPWADANFEKIDETWLWMPNFGILRYVENPGQKPTPVERHVDILGKNINMQQKSLKHLFYKKRILNALLVRFSAFLSQNFF